MNLKIAIVSLAIFISIKGIPQQLDCESLLKEIISFEENHNYLKAKETIEKNMNSLNDCWFDLSKELIFVNEKLGLYKENFEIFKKGHEKGYFYFITAQIPKYKNYEAYNEFEAISIKDFELLNTANEKSETIFEVQLPQNFDCTIEYPIIFLLHGGGKNISDVKKHWQTTEINTHFIKVYVQSYRHFDSNTYGWPSLNERLINDFKGIYKEISMNYNVDTSFVLMGGISAGANLTLEIGLQNILPVYALIAYCPGIPVFIEEMNFELINYKKIKVSIFTGEKDIYLNRQQDLVEILDSLKIENRFEIIPDIGHAYPIDEEEAIKKSFDFFNLKFTN